MSKEYELEKIIENVKQGLNDGELAAKLVRYRELATEIELMEESKAALRKELIFLGRGQESISAGGYACFFKPVKGRESIDWRRYVSDVVGNPSDADLAPYTKRAEDSVRVEVKRL